MTQNPKRTKVIVSVSGCEVSDLAGFKQRLSPAGASLVLPLWALWKLGLTGGRIPTGLTHRFQGRQASFLPGASFSRTAWNWWKYLRSLTYVSALFKRRFYKLLIKLDALMLEPRGPSWKNESCSFSFSKATTISSAGAPVKARPSKALRGDAESPRGEAAAGWEAGLEQPPQFLSPRARQAVALPASVSSVS